MPTTLRLSADTSSDIHRAADLLRSGATVAFPTETVYGLGASALDPAAVARIFAAKQRPAWDPLIVHIACPAQLAEITRVPAALEARIAALTAAFWPGPLTLLLPRTSAIPDAVTAGRPLVGVRIPAHPIAHELLSLAALPIAAPSANTFSHTSPTTAAHVLADLDGRIDAVLDAGPSTVGLESTVLDPERMIVYRPGAVTLAQIEAACGTPATLFTPAQTDVSAGQNNAPPQSLPSPGVGIRHYAPRAQLILVEGKPEALQRAYKSHPAGTGVLLPSNWTLSAADFSLILDWGHWDRPEELASRLFAALRTLDDRGATHIVCPLPPAGGLADAIRDRLEKAARRA